MQETPTSPNSLCPDPATDGRPAAEGGPERFVGIDVGAETIKVAEVLREGDRWALGRRELLEHGKQPGPRLVELLRGWDWPGVRRAAVSGRLSQQVRLPRVPAQHAQARGFRFLLGHRPATLVSIGSQGFSVLELRANGTEVFRENSRCSQGTGNFLRQLVERFSLSLSEAGALSAAVERPAPLSGRCPVILKTDMTHLANKGENRAEILAGLFDAVCENVLVLLRPGVSPPEVYLLGGVSRSPRIQRTFRASLEKAGLRFCALPGEAALFLEALGSALVAADSTTAPPALSGLIAPPGEVRFNRVAALSASLHRVRRMPAAPPGPPAAPGCDLILGFDIGSTGSKLLALAAGPAPGAAGGPPGAPGRERADVLWQGYRRTLGDPVGAAQALWAQFVAEYRVAHRLVAVGVTGSGREIVGSLLATCYGRDAVFILNEIAAHAAGALHYDPRVDTIFEIGGQDAKYIRLAEGRVVDCAMNEACSAGTGSFIEEQGRKFAGVTDVAQLGRLALAAPGGVSLGQHCSVFMAEIIDRAVAAGVEQGEIIAGLYDSIIQNYLHRVKGTRSVGKVIFCQGMPFASDALAAAVARQTGSEVIVPPHPGMVGALGIALLARRELPWARQGALDPARFLDARIEQKETFVCKATTGCGGAGNKCRIDSIRTIVAGQRQRFTWGGGCSLHDKGTRKRKLPDRAPDPFRERDELLQRLCEATAAAPPDAPLPAAGPTAQRVRSPRVALADEFLLKGLFPFFAVFLRRLGCELWWPAPADQATLKRGIQAANIPFCAPMQLFHGLAAQMAEAQPDYVFVPMLRSTPRCNGEADAAVCPIAQGCGDVLKWDLQGRLNGNLLSPVMDLGRGNLASVEFLESCARLAAQLGVTDERWRTAHRAAALAQAQFERDCEAIGHRALAFCRAHDLVPVVVLGRPYTIYNRVLNSNVPALLREQGAIAIPVDCYPLPADAPVFDDIYWGHSQRSLRAAHHIRRTPGVWSVFCSNYACGPDSFGLHFYAYLMEGKPYAIIETDGHAGDAGTKTRLEAFLHCVEQERRAGWAPRPANRFSRIAVPATRLKDLPRSEAILVPYMGPVSDVLSAGLRGLGHAAETLPAPDAESLRLGRRFTSGKECVPMCMTLGTLLRRIREDPDPQRRFTLVMPRTRGPCRFGMYNLLNNLTLERLGWRDRVNIWAPCDRGYFDDTPPAFAAVLFAGFVATDLLGEALLDSRPDEIRPGAANAIYQRHQRRVIELVEARARAAPGAGRLVWELARGELFGLAAVLREAAAEFAAARRRQARPTVLVVGEIYVRCVPFANDFVLEKLEQRGCRARLAPCYEWLEYVDHVNVHLHRRHDWSSRFSRQVQAHLRHRAYSLMAGPLGWPARAPVACALEAAAPYLRSALEGEAVMTLGTPLHEWAHGQIDAVISVGPLECMPNKLAEAQFFHAREQTGLPSLTLPLLGDPMNVETLDNFVFEVHNRFRRRQERSPGGVAA